MLEIRRLHWLAKQRRSGDVGGPGENQLYWLSTRGDADILGAIDQSVDLPPYFYTPVPPFKNGNLRGNLRRSEERCPFYISRRNSRIHLHIRHQRRHTRTIARVKPARRRRHSVRLISSRRASGLLHQSAHGITVLATTNFEPWSLATTSMLGFPRFLGQVGKGHVLTTRLSIDDQTQNYSLLYLPRIWEIS